MQNEAGGGDRLVFDAHRLGEREDIVLVIFVVAVVPIDFEASGRGRGQERIRRAGDCNRDVDFFLQFRLADIGDRAGAGLHRALLGDLRAGRIEQRAALGGVFIEVGKFLAILAPLDQRFLVARGHLGETAEPVLHVAQPVAALGIFAFVDDIDADLALPRDDCRHIIGEMRLVADRHAGVERQERKTADMGRQDLRDASLHGARVYSAASTALSRPARTRRPGMAPVCSPRSKIGVPATSVAS